MAKRMTANAKVHINSKKRLPGRPREFDYTAAVRAAMLVFWSKGFEGASLADLTSAMGVSRPTLYSAFGDKEGLFREALCTYVGLRAEDYTAALERHTVREIAEAWLRLTGGVRPESDVPTGCLIVQAALVGSEASRQIQHELAAIRKEGTKLLRKRLESLKQEGDSLGGWEPDLLAQYLSALSAGLAVQSNDGASPQVLNRVVDQVVANLPSPRGRKRSLESVPSTADSQAKVSQNP